MEQTELVLTTKFAVGLSKIACSGRKFGCKVLRLLSFIVFRALKDFAKQQLWGLIWRDKKHFKLWTKGAESDGLKTEGVQGKASDDSQALTPESRRRKVRDRIPK